MSFIKPILRALIVSYASIYLTQKIVGGFFFGLDRTQTFSLVVVALAVINLFLVPILRILSMPHRGFMLLFLSFILISITFYILPMFLSGFSIMETDTAELRILGYVLPSSHLSVNMATLVSGFAVAFFYHFLEWVCEKR